MLFVTVYLTCVLCFTVYVTYLLCVTVYLTCVLCVTVYVACVLCVTGVDWNATTERGGRRPEQFYQGLLQEPG